MIYFAGIGSRDITNSDISKINQIKTFLLENVDNVTIISSNADGSDIEWQRNFNHYSILPWNNFNFQSFKPDNYYTLNDLDFEAYTSVNDYHPNPEVLTTGAIKLMARNYLQIYPPIKKDGVNFVIYIADESQGKVMGGTGQAVRIAKSNNIPTYNLRLGNLQNFIQWYYTYVEKCTHNWVDTSCWISDIGEPYFNEYSEEFEEVDNGYTHYQRTCTKCGEEEDY